ncbi:glutathione S-transferase [Zopfochytrium polystomum]|nr:glutathione S-transferase [Zopfochytrium polystomum]
MQQDPPNELRQPQQDRQQDPQLLDQQQQETEPPVLPEGGSGTQDNGDALQPPIEEPEDINTGLHLVWGSGSGPSRKVMMALYEKGFPFQGQLVSFDNKDTQRAEWISRLNPRKQVPFLVDNGLVVTQSHAILLYLEDVHKEAQPLLPSVDNMELRTKVLARMFEADDVIVRRMQEVLAKASAKGSSAAAQLEGALADFFAELDIWEDHLAKNASAYVGGWLVGSQITLADIALFPLVSTCVERFALDLTKKHARLHAWHSQVSVRPSARNSRPPHWDEKEPKVVPFRSKQ